MSGIIEHPNSGDGNIEVIKIGEASAPVSLKTYQDIYHQVTGRTEQIKKRYSENLLVEFSEIEQLHHKIKQLCDVHNIVASNEVVSVFHEKERKEQFTSFERFRAYNSNTASPTVTLVLKYNFSIIPAGRERPQEYAVTVRLTSRVAMLEQVEREAPSFVRPHLVGIVALNTAEVTVDYSDYVIARGFLEAVDEWVGGCRKTPPINWLNVLRRWSHFAPGISKLIAGGLLAWFALQSIPAHFSATATTEVGARFFVVYGSGALILVPLMGAIGGMIEEAIDSYPILSYLKLNKGDSNLIEQFSERKRSVFIKLFFSAVASIALGIVSAKLERLI
ncbi:hypothetical protein [Limnobacter sp.]|uniref:hypothetical protein n=1 Tax=Limnobacter sp. TaxID=2003368 RepID=UPI003748647D